MRVFRRGPRNWVVILSCLVVSLTEAGCGSLARWSPGGWVADYEISERRVAETGREMLIYYRASDRNKHDGVAEALKDDRVKQRTDQYVRCKLFRSYEPDRRYVAQFAVERAPALIVVHPDGTYHARTGSMTPADILAFLHEAQAPGMAFTPNPYVPRRFVYSWHRDPQAARAEARQSGKAILFVFYHGLSRDWPVLKKMLHRPEVYIRFEEMVHCRLSSFDSTTKQEAAFFGVDQWPAIVIVHPDGTYQMLKMPISGEQIVRFADAQPRGGGDAAGGSSTTAAARP